MSQKDTYDFCPSCGASIPFGNESCPQCGRSTVKMGDEQSWGGRPDPRRKAPERSSRPGISGGLMLLMGVPTLLFGLLLIGQMELLIELIEEQLILSGSDATMAETWVNIMVYGSLLVGVITSAGGIAAIMRRYWWLAMAGAAVLIIGGLSMIVPGIIGIICAVLLYQSRAEFS